MDQEYYSPLGTQAATLGETQQPVLIQVLEDMRQHEKRLRGMIERLSSYADTLVGPQMANSSGAKEGPRPAPLGLLGELQDVSRRVDQAMRELSGQVERSCIL